MKLKHVVVLISILILLIGGVIYKQMQKPAELATEQYTAIDLSFNSDQVHQIEVSKGKDEQLVELSKEGGAWLVLNFFKVKADHAKIDNLLSTLKGV